MKDFMDWRLLFGLIIAASVGFAAGHRRGVYDAADGFYEKCQGGEIYFDENGKTLTLVGCAEIARKINR